jgi:PAS domain S-box-containing protein
MRSETDYSITVLSIDDEPAWLDIISDSLERVADHLRVARTHIPEEAFERLRDNGDSIDCILCDYQMPAMNGFEFLARLRESNHNVPFILYTGRGSEDIAAEAFRHGVNDYIQKGTGTGHFLMVANRIDREVARTRADAEKATRLAALEAVREGICIVDATGQVRYANEAYIELYQYDYETLVGQPWQTLHPDGEVETITNTVLPHIERHGTWEGESVGLRADGTTFRESKSVAELPRGELVIVVTEHETSVDDGEGAIA